MARTGGSDARNWVSTDDAFIDTHTVQVSAQVAGRVKTVLANDNQEVHAGQPLVELDPADFQAALSQALANHESAQGQLAQAKAQLPVAQANLDQARAQVGGRPGGRHECRHQPQTRSDAGANGRAGRFPTRQLDNDTATERSDAANLAAAQQKRSRGAGPTGLNKTQIETAEAGVRAAAAQVQQARLNLSYTVIRALGETGHVTNKSVALGNYVQVGQALMALVPDQVWVTANFKETEIGEMRTGDPVDIYVDAYPGHVFHGQVQSFQAGSGAAFSLLPPENATGNYVKVVQRVPVKIVFDGDARRALAARPRHVGRALCARSDEQRLPTATGGGSRATIGGRSVSPWLVAPTVGLAAFMEVLDISIVNVSLQHVAGSMAATPDEATWILTAYLVTNAIVLPISGWLSETFGRKRYFLGSILGFSITSLFCGLAPTLSLLILARGLQGIAGGGLQPTAQAFLADAFPPERRGQAFAMYGLAVVFAPAIGPTVGGWITDNSELALGVSDQRTGRHRGQRCWRCSSSPIRRGRLPPDGRGRRRAEPRLYRPRPAGDRHVCVAVRARQGPGGRLVRLRADHRSGRNRGVALVAFVVWELRRADPIVDLHLFRDRAFASGNLLMFMLGFALMGTTVVLPLFVQTLLGYTAEQAGMVLSPGGFATMLMMPVAGALSGRIDARLLDHGRVDRHRDRDVPLVRLRPERRFFDARLGAGLSVPGVGAAVHPDQHRRLSGHHGREECQRLGDHQHDAQPWRQRRHRDPDYLYCATPAGQPGHADPTRDALQRQTNQMLKQLQQAFVAAHGSAGGALHQAQAELYAIVQQQAAVLSYLDAFWLVGAVLVAMIPLVLLLRKPVPAAAPPLHCRRTPFARCRRCHPGTRLSLQKGCASAAIQGAANGRSRHARVSSEERRRSVLTPDSRIAIIGLMGFDPCRRSQYPRRNARTWAVHSAGFSKGGQWPQLLSRTRRELAMWLRIAIETSNGTIRS